jgi:hypothetical protein
VRVYQISAPNKIANNRHHPLSRARLTHRSDDGGSNHIRNVSQLLRDCKAKYPARLSPPTRRRENLKSHCRGQFEVTFCPFVWANGVNHIYLWFGRESSRVPLNTSNKFSCRPVREATKTERLAVIFSEEFQGLLSITQLLCIQYNPLHSDRVTFSRVKRDGAYT